MAEALGFHVRVIPFERGEFFISLPTDGERRFGAEEKDAERLLRRIIAGTGSVLRIILTVLKVTFQYQETPAAFFGNVILLPFTLCVCILTPGLTRVCVCMRL